MGKRSQVPWSDPPDEERPSGRVRITPLAMQPVLEESSRTANRIREELGLLPRRYDLVAFDVYERVMSAEVVENVRVAVLQALARSARDETLSFRVYETTMNRLLCWAFEGRLYVPERAGEASADEIVQAERRAHAR